LNRAFTAYLAGPITGLDYAGATDWRDHATACLAPFGIKALSPLRSKGYLRGVESFSADGDVYRDLSVLSTNRGIMTRDRHDATRCDVLLVNLLGAERVSIGTVMEIAWADACRTPIVCAIEPKGNPHEHGMVLEAIGFRVTHLDDAINIVKAIAGNGAA
jgi:nucleoside 2-deoxyribosyltransferase